MASGFAPAFINITACDQTTLQLLNMFICSFGKTLSMAEQTLKYFRDSNWG
jgi:hypothetical protein